MQHFHSVGTGLEGSKPTPRPKFSATTVEVVLIQWGLNPPTPPPQQIEVQMALLCIHDFPIFAKQHKIMCIYWHSYVYRAFIHQFRLSAKLFAILLNGRLQCLDDVSDDIRQGSLLYSPSPTLTPPTIPAFNAPQWNADKTRQQQ